MGLLTKIFGNSDGGASASEEPSPPEPAPRADDAGPAGFPDAQQGDPGSSGIRPAVEAPRAREARPNAASRRPEHPRMYLRPPPSTIDPALPGSTRRQQISVRPGTKDTPGTLRGPGVSRRSSPEPRLPERRLPQRSIEYEPPSEPPATPRPPLSRSRTALVVSPVSLTPEELQQQSSSRQKMPTLTGLGALISAPASPAAQRPSDPPPSNATSGPPAAEDAPPRASHVNGVEASTTAEPGFAPPPEPDAGAAARALAAFALQLSLGPVSRRWAPEVRRAAELLQRTGKERGEAGLTGLAERLLDLVPNEPAEPPDGATPEPFDGPAREQLLHEVTSLAGLLPEWPPAAQDLAEEARRREARVIRELLGTFDGLRRDQRARAEQQLGLEQLTTMGEQALAEEFDLALDRALELRLLLGRYRDERRARAPELEDVRAIRPALTELEARARAFDACDPEDKAEQRQLREQRRRALTALHLLLAERGELERLDALDVLSVAERIERLREWLDGEQGSS